MKFRMMCDREFAPTRRNKIVGWVFLMQDWMTNPSQGCFAFRYVWKNRWEWMKKDPELNWIQKEEYELLYKIQKWLDIRKM